MILTDKRLILRGMTIMRKNQVEIKISRFEDGAPEVINVYVDSNNLFEALSVAYSEAIRELQKYETIPSFGRVDVSSSCRDKNLYNKKEF